MAFQLIIVKGRSASQTLQLAGPVTTIGRQPGCQLQVKSSQVSRKHCELFEKKGLLLVKDLGSSNGTFVNGQRVADQRVLEPGDELTVGGVTFRIGRDDQAAPAAAARPARAGDTAVAEAVELDDADLVEVDAADVIEIDEDTEKTVLQTPAAVASPTPKPAPVPEPESTPPEEAPSAPEIGEDAVADFLFNLDVDDEDRT